MHFSEHLEILRERFILWRLDQLVQALRDGKPINRTVVITFDDGYADNLYNAKPLLDRYEIPATVFVTTGYIGHEREFWWDELDRLLLQPASLPGSLRLTINGKEHHWNLTESTSRIKDTHLKLIRRIRGTGAISPNRRLYNSLLQLLKPLPKEERWKILDEVMVWVGEGPTGRSTHRPLSHNELVSLKEGGLLEVGAHTISHPVLSALPAAKQRAEIAGSKVRLEEILGYPVTCFAYPFSPQHYTAESVSIVRDAGFTCACTTNPDLVWAHADPFQLPRILVRDCDGDALVRQIEGWFHG
jgi:peptidoglycan/xylan/chitin deacetylase (PgdA/CDA1 family)